MDLPRKVLICQHTTCRKQGADAVFQAFLAEAPAAAGLEERQCLGQCGNGPMVLILPDNIWYSRVQPQDVPKICEQHLQHGKPVREKLYREFHPAQKTSTNWIIWALVIASGLLMLGLLAFGVYWARLHPL